MGMILMTMGHGKRWWHTGFVWAGLRVMNALALTTQVDVVTMHHGQKAAIPVLKNDSGDLVTSSLAIVSAPLYGTATSQANGRILYHHTTGTPAMDMWTYQVQDVQGATSLPETVSVTFSTQGRIAASLTDMPLAPPATPYEVVEAFPGLVFNVLSSMESVPGESNRLFVVERAGRIYAITNSAGASYGATMFLDLSERVRSVNELGMKGIAFHPGYATNRTFFVTYCTTQGTVRLSRFQCSTNDAQVADLGSEVVLLDQVNDGEIHNIDDAVFGPDGYLYVGFGDEGVTNSAQSNTQNITNDLWSAIIRIDPDKRPGNPPPNPHPAIRTNALGEAFYAVPADNPFIGVTQFNGMAVSPEHVRTEMYAVGLRNPWQFSFDALTGELWVGDVGQTQWEEVNLISPGANGGWSYWEGTHPGLSTPPPGVTYDAPLWAYFHDNLNPLGGSAVIGGLVMRSTNYPDLVGTYVFGDFISGNIWSLLRVGPTVHVQRITGHSYVAQYGMDPADGSLLLLQYEPGALYRLKIGASTQSFPATLSDTGVFADLDDLSPNPGLVRYELNLPFWSDYAIKRRWFGLTNLNDGIGFEREGPWTSPTGMIWVKHFDLDLDRGNTNTRKRIETRLLVRGTNGTYGVSYRWNEAGTEASLAPDQGENFVLSVTNAGIPGVQQWRIPSRAECMVCHQAGGGHALGFNTRQLNRDGQLAASTGNQLDLLAAAGYFTNTVVAPGLVPRYVRPNETNYSLDVRARSYLAVNCGYCHSGLLSPVPATWDARAHTPLSSCGMIRVPAVDNGGDTNNLLLVPGSVSHSIIWNRIAVSNGFTRMPPLASSETDPAGIQLVADWIAAELPAWQSYADWRLLHFGTNAVLGDPQADPDEDGQNNYNEYLTYGSPTNADSGWGGAIQRGAGGVEVEFDLFNRRVKVESSSDLVQWQEWPVAGNHGLSLASGTVSRIAAPASGTGTFYRFRVEEP